VHDDPERNRDATGQDRVDGLHNEATVGAEPQVNKVATGVLGKVGGVGDAADDPYRAALQCVDGLKLGRRNAGLAAAGDDALMTRHSRMRVVRPALPQHKDVRPERARGPQPSAVRERQSFP